MCCSAGESNVEPSHDWRDRWAIEAVRVFTLTSAFSADPDPPPDPHSLASPPGCRESLEHHLAVAAGDALPRLLRRHSRADPHLRDRSHGRRLRRATATGRRPVQVAEKRRENARVGGRNAGNPRCGFRDVREKTRRLQKGGEKRRTSPKSKDLGEP